jgi:hypothetical protein
LRACERETFGLSFQVGWIKSHRMMSPPDDDMMTLAGPAILGSAGEVFP